MEVVMQKYCDQPAHVRKFAESVTEVLKRYKIDKSRMEEGDFWKNICAQTKYIDDPSLIGKWAAGDKTNRIPSEPWLDCLEEARQQLKQKQSGEPFSKRDEGKTVTITGDKILVDGEARMANWGYAKHHDLTGTIKSVDEKKKGKVKLADGQEFQNFAKPLDSEWVPLPITGVERTSAYVHTYIGRTTAEPCA